MTLEHTRSPGMFTRSLTSGHRNKVTHVHQLACSSHCLWDCLHEAPEAWPLNDFRVCGAAPRTTLPLRTPHSPVSR